MIKDIKAYECSNGKIFKRQEEAIKEEKNKIIKDEIAHFMRTNDYVTTDYVSDEIVDMIYNDYDKIVDMINCINTKVLNLKLEVK